MEHRAENLPTHLGVERRPALEEAGEPDVAFEDDQGADALLGEFGRRARHLVDDQGLRPTVTSEKTAPAHLCQYPTDVVLKEHDHEQEERAEEGPQDPGKRVELEVLGEEVHAGEDREADQHLHRPRATDQVDRRIDQDRDDQDIRDVGDAHLTEDTHRP